MNEINIKKVKLLTISQEIKETLKQGQDIVFIGSASVIEARFRDNQDSTTNVTYIAKPMIVDIRQSDTEISIVDDKKIKQKSRSQALRQKCFVIAQELGEDENKLYNLCMDKAEEELELLKDELVYEK